MLKVRSAVEFQAVFGVSRETAARLAIYVDTLREWQKSINLVAPGTVNEIWQRHLADSAQIFALAPCEWRRWVDFGSGAGFPGLVVAILAAERSGVCVSLIESDVRKCAFLREVVRKTGIGHSLSVDILPGRIENPEIRSKVGDSDVVSARALAPLSELFALVAPYFGQTTVGLFHKGRDAAAEVEAARGAWRFEVDMVTSLTEATARVLIVRGLESAEV